MLVAMGLMTTSALAASHAARAATTYNNKGVKFSYPSNWKRLSASQSNIFGQELVSAAGGVVKLAGVGGVEQPGKKQASIAIVTKMNFTSAFQKKLKGNRQKFISKFKEGVAKSKSTKKVYSVGTGHFAGQAKAFEMQVELRSNGTLSRDQFWVAISSNNKSVYMAIFVVVPQNAWSKYANTLASIAASSRFS